MAISSVLTNTFKTELLKGLHSFDTAGATPAGNAFKIALYSSGSANLGTTTLFLLELSRFNFLLTILAQRS